TGPVYEMRSTPIGPEDTAGTLHDVLAELGASALVDTLPRVADGLAPTPQPDEGATYAPILTKADGALDFDEPADRVSCRARGMLPWPGAFSRFRDKLVKIHDAVAVAYTGDAAPGTLLGVEDGRLQIACASGAIAVQTLQVEGRSRQTAEDFIRGYQPEAGERFTLDPRVAQRRD